MDETESAFYSAENRVQHQRWNQVRRLVAIGCWIDGMASLPLLVDTSLPWWQRLIGATVIGVGPLMAFVFLWAAAWRRYETPECHWWHRPIAYHVRGWDWGTERCRRCGEERRFRQALGLDGSA